MIGDETARYMGIKFLREEKCFRLAGAMEQEDACLNETFARAVRTLGKKKVAQLYGRLPKQLRIYVLWCLDPGNDERLGTKFMDIFIKYGYISDAWPDKCEDFADYCREAEEALLKYLTRR